MSGTSKEYRQTLEALDAETKLNTHHAKFNKLRHSTEDAELARLLDALIGNLQKAMSVRLQPGQRPATLIKAAPAAKALREYCDAQISSAKPQWQILAERAGWAPPH